MDKKEKRRRLEFAGSMDRVYIWCKRKGWIDTFENTFDEHIGKIREKYHLTIDQLSSELGGFNFDNLVDCGFEIILTQRHGPEGKNILDEYLRHRKFREPPQGKKYLEALRDSVMSLYEVVEVNPGTGIFLRDMLRKGDPIAVRDVAGSNNLVKWDRLGCRILPVGENNYLSNTVLFFGNEISEDLPGMLREAIDAASPDMKNTSGGNQPSASPEILKKKNSKEEAANVAGHLDESELSQCGFAISRIWLDSFLKDLYKPEQKIANSDNEELAFYDVWYPISQNAEEGIQYRLNNAREFMQEEGDGLSWSWVEHRSKKAKSKNPPPTPDGPSPLMFEAYDAFDVSTRILGDLGIKDSQLFLSVNSRERAQRGMDLIDKLLGTLVGEGHMELVDEGEILNELEQPTIGDEGEKLSPEEEAVLMENFLDEHYHKWIDTPIAAVERKSPRQASRSKQGREKVCSLLKSIENMELRAMHERGKRPYDTSWMWEALGITDLK